MSEDRFKPPSADVQDPRRGQGSVTKGVVVGLLVDLVGTTVFGVVVSVLYGIALAAAGNSAKDIEATLGRADSDPLLSTVFLAGGVLCSVLGGYVCERIARQGNYKVGATLGLLSAAIGLVMGADASSSAMLALLIFLTIGSVLLGTRLAFQAPEKRVDR